MPYTCTRCQGEGFLNLDQVPANTYAEAQRRGDFHERILAWMDEQMEAHDVQVCDCCGDGESWYGTPGEHPWSETAACI